MRSGCEVRAGAETRGALLLRVAVAAVDDDLDAWVFRLCLYGPKVSDSDNEFPAKSRFLVYVFTIFLAHVYK